MQPHPASHLSVSIHSRGKGHSATAAAAYRARGLVRDRRTGLEHDYRRAPGLLSNELINWTGTIEDLWNTAEEAEKHPRACLAREIRVALPAELTIEDQVHLVRGLCLWLRDEYGVASQASLHAPNFKDKGLARRFAAKPGAPGWDSYIAALRDPEKTNLNFHGHVLCTTRRVDPETGIFGAKTRILDDLKTGPAEVLRIRQEWQKRVNALLAKRGHEPSVDMRSHAAMIAAGDAPSGLVAQEHLGPKATAAGRRSQLENNDTDVTPHGVERRRRRQNNTALRDCWERIRAAEREKARHEESIAIARDREAQRLAERDRERMALKMASTAHKVAEVLSQAAQVHALRPQDAMAQALAWAQRGGPPPDSCSPEFDQQIDPEEWTSPDTSSGPPSSQPVVRKPSPAQRQRTRTE